MKADDTLRYLAYEAQRCRSRDSCEALCLLFPPLLKALGLPPMDESEARAFHERVKQALTNELRRAA